MSVKGKKVGFALTGAFPAFDNTIRQIKKLVDNGANVYPIMSFNSYKIDNKFGKAVEFREKIIEITGNQIIKTIEEAEVIGRKNKLDVLVIAPCSGNTIAKLANNIIDTPVTVVVNSYLRNEKPVVIGICANNALSSSAENIGKLLNRKYYFFIPFKQDNPITKPRSMVYDFEYTIKAIEYALKYKQISPIIL